MKPVTNWFSRYAWAAASGSGDEPNWVLSAAQFVPVPMSSRNSANWRTPASHNCWSLASSSGSEAGSDGRWTGGDSAYTKFTCAACAVLTSGSAR